MWIVISFVSAVNCATEQKSLHVELNGSDEHVWSRNNFGVFLMWCRTSQGHFLEYFCEINAIEFLVSYQPGKKLRPVCKYKEKLNYKYDRLTTTEKATIYIFLQNEFFLTFVITSL